jgi:hypothetical protein
MRPYSMWQWSCVILLMSLGGIEAATVRHEDHYVVKYALVVE